MKENKIGVCDFSFPCGGLVGVKMAGLSGFEGLQIADQSALNQGFPLLNPIVRDMYLETAAKYNLVFQGLNLYALCFSNTMGSPLNSSTGEMIKDYIRKSAETCKLMQIGTVMMNVNNIHFVSKPSIQIMENIKETLKFANECFKDVGTTLSIETCIPAKMFHEIREEIGDNLKMCLDIANPVFHGIGNPPDLIREYGLDAIDHFHIKDFKPGYFGYTTQNAEMCWPGEGAAKFDECVKVIKEGGFKGWYISESIYTMPNFYDSKNGLDPIASGRKDAEIMRKAFLS